MDAEESVDQQHSDPPLLAAALAYASRGWHVFPLHTVDARRVCTCYKQECKSPGKHPRTVQGHKEATTDEAIIKRWWDMWSEANIGVVTGQVSGIVVLDIDTDKGGEDSLADLERQYGKIPNTVEAVTGGGGRHILFTHPGVPVPCSAGKLGPGLDVRGDGGYIVAAPSRHASGRDYVWEASSHPEDVPLAPMPSWLLERLQERHRPGERAAPVEGSIPEGQRNHTLTSLAGSMRRRGMTEEAIRAALLQENAAKCDPPLSEDEVASIARSVARYEPGEDSLRLGFDGSQPGAAGGHAGARESQADQLVRLALARTEIYFTDQFGAPYALVDGEAVSLGRPGAKWLRQLQWEAHGKAASSEAVNTALEQMVAQAEFSGEQRTLSVRVAEVEGEIHYDLGPGRCVRIDYMEGWQLATTPPGVFRRYPGQRPQPDPLQGGSLEWVLDLLPLKSERDKRLFIAYLVAGLCPDVPRPLLLVTGPMGSGKTTVHRIVKRLIDPQEPESIRLDGEATQKAAHQYAVLIDNAGHLTNDQADMVCRWVTGEADSKRRLYSDDEDTIYAFKRLVLLNGINVPTERADLLDRSLILELERIPADKRREEAEMYAELERRRPETLGGLFTTLWGSLTRKGDVSLVEKPRLADWGRLAAAVYEAMGWSAELFEADWADNLKRQHAGTREGNIIVGLLLTLAGQTPLFQGTTTDLYQKLSSIAMSSEIYLRNDPTWPKSAAWLGRRIRELLATLEASGLVITWRDDPRGTWWTVGRPGAAARAARSAPIYAGYQR